MKKILFLSALLTVAFAAQAQLKIAPKMQKGDVKNYTIVVTNSIPITHIYWTLTPCQAQ